MSASGSIRMLVLGGEEFLLTAMRTALRVAPEVSVIAVRERPGGLADVICDADPAIAVIEATDDTTRACGRLREARDACPGALIVVIVAEFDMELFEEATRRGALACLGGPGPSSALRALLARPHVERPILPQQPQPQAPPPAPPDSQLTAREQEILSLVAEGRTNLEISRALWLAEQTVKFHLSKIYRKLGVANRTEASRHALLYGVGSASVTGLEPRLRHIRDHARAAGATGV